MAKAKDINTPEEVLAHIQKLESPVKEMVQAIRETILSADPMVCEQIKWNSPSFFYSGHMQPFDPKEYKRDIVVINIHRGYPLLVFPTGARVADDTGLLEGKYTDGRRTITFKSPKEINLKKDDLIQIIRTWLAGVE